MALKEQIEEALSRNPTDSEIIKDYFSLGIAKNDVKIIESVRRMCDKICRERTAPAKDLISAYDILKQTYFVRAKEDFHSFLIYLEWERNFKSRFYDPRKHYLAPIVDGYQQVGDGKLDLLTISLPKRAGKSQTEICGVLWLSGRHPDRSSLMEGAGDALVTSFYKGCLEYLTEGNEYLYYDVFPEARLAQTNADLKTIDLEKISRFPTIMCRSIEATQVGLSEATNLLCLDDCVKGREEAENRELMDKKWDTIRGDVLGRAIEGTPIIATGTRYSIYDPIGRLLDHARDNGWRYKEVTIPALNEKEESNLEYFNPKINRKVFTTDFFRQQKKLISAEQWESEFQQEPFEAKGQLFPDDKLQRYFQLPCDRDPDTVIACCDTAEGGGDSVMMPIAYVYGDDVFIEDCVFDNSAPEYTKPQCINKLIEHKVRLAVFESNNAGEYYARDIDVGVSKQGGKCAIRTKRSINKKTTRIETASDGILKHFWFKDKSLYESNSQYGRMLKEVTQYVRTGKVKHDDAPDGLAMLENEIRNIVYRKTEVINRPW